MATKKTMVTTVLYTANVPDRYGDVISEASLIKMAEGNDNMSYNKNLKQLVLNKKVDNNIMQKLMRK